MRIERIRTLELHRKIDGPGFGWSQRTTDARQSVLCVVSTDSGLTGVGEAFYYNGPTNVVTAVIHGVFAPLLAGQDPLDTSVLWDRCYNATRDQGQKGVTVCALSAIDIALWDIKGKALGLPVHKLLGGAYRTKVRAYATGLYEPQGSANVVEALVEEALGYKSQGFRGVKLKVGYGHETDVSYVAAVRNAIGPEMTLMLDANHAYNAREALRLVHAIAPYDIYWLEEPVPPEDLDGYAELRSRSEIPIAGGECEFTRYGFRDLISRRAVDILQPDLCAAGGFTEAAHILSLASAANLPVLPHVWGTNVGLAAALQFAAAVPHTPERRYPAEFWFELDRSPHPFRDHVTHESFELSDGCLCVPLRPGLGVTLDEEFLARNAG
jgi:D-galactarolactone cycloisomerase